MEGLGTAHLAIQLFFLSQYTLQERKLAISSF